MTTLNQDGDLAYTDDELKECEDCGTEDELEDCPWCGIAICSNCYDEHEANESGYAGEDEELD